MLLKAFNFKSHFLIRVHLNISFPILFSTLMTSIILFNYKWTVASFCFSLQFESLFF